MFKDKFHDALNKIKHPVVNILKAKKLKKSGASLYDVLGICWKEWRRDDVDDMAKSMAFSFILAVFPGIIFLFTLIPYIPIANLDVIIMNYLSHVMPQSLYELTSGAIKDIISKERGQLLSFGFLFALFSATNGSLAMIEAFNKIHNDKERRSFFKTRLVGLGLTVVLTLVLVLSVLALVIGNLVLDYLVSIHFLADLVSLGIMSLNYFILIITFFCAISYIYYAAPVYTRRIRFFSPGSILATILIIVVTTLFSIYVNNFSNYNKVYGSIGTIIVFMLWMYAISLVILIGFELNSSLETTHKIFFRKQARINEDRTKKTE